MVNPAGTRVKAYGVASKMCTKDEKVTDVCVGPRGRGRQAEFFAGTPSAARLENEKQTRRRGVRPTPTPFPRGSRRQRGCTCDRARVYEVRV